MNTWVCTCMWFVCVCPIDKMQQITGIAPLKQRRYCNYVHQSKKHERTEKRGHGRLKRTSLIRNAKALQEKFKEELPVDVEQIVGENWENWPLP